MFSTNETATLKELNGMDWTVFIHYNVWQVFFF